MKTIIPAYSSAFIFMLCGTAIPAQLSSSPGGWTTSLADRKVFIENKGQFTEDEQNPIQEKILYYARQGRVRMYFTAGSVVFRYDSIHTEEGEGKKEERIKVIPYFLKMNWENANPGVSVSVQNPAPDYFTYTDPRDPSGSSGITAYAYGKLIYRNLYNNVDVEFHFPQDSGGIKYTLILRPGAGVSGIRMRYSTQAAVSMTNEGNLKISCPPFDAFTDHAPKAYYEDGEPVPSAFDLNGNTVSFKLQTSNYSPQTLIIDPWTTGTNFSPVNMGYDIECDVAGNTYVYGGEYGQFQLKKYNSAGVLQWTYLPGFAVGTYGDFTTDARSGRSYVVEPYNGSGARIRKVNASGGLITTFAGNANIEEMWRVKFDYCNNRLVIGSGGTNLAYQACTIDTNLSGASFNAVNVLGAAAFEAFHDITLLALDNSGQCFMATSEVFPPGSNLLFNNVMLRVPLPSLSPTAYQVSDGYAFEEGGTCTYIGSCGGFCSSVNGFNGMAALPNAVFTYNGQILKKWNPSNGAFISQVNTGGTLLTSMGGLDVCSGNIYAGRGSTIRAYNPSTLALVTTYAVSNTIYDLALGYNGELFACGDGYVQQVLNTLTPIAGFCNKCPVLPVELLSFSAKCLNVQPGKEPAVQLNWSTATETGNGYFIIEKSRDGKIFGEIGRMNGAGNSSTALNYSFVDREPLPEINYYRLKQTDFDGQSKYADVIAVENCYSPSPVNIHPNPAGNELVIEIFCGERCTPAELEITDLMGGTIKTDILEVQQGNNVHKISLEGFSPGMYFLKAVSESNETQTKFVKE